MMQTTELTERDAAIVAMYELLAEAGPVERDSSDSFWERPLCCTFCGGKYEAPSMLTIVVSGSPARGTLVVKDIGYSPLNAWVLDNEAIKLGSKQLEVVAAFMEHGITMPNISSDIAAFNCVVYLPGTEIKPKDHPFYNERAWLPADSKNVY